MNLHFLILIIFLPTITFGQKCDCKANFLWLKETIEVNDAGFQYIIDQKGTDAYELHNKIIRSRLENIEDISECRNQLESWLRFFRKGHLFISAKQSTQTNTKQPTQSKDISDVYVKKFKRKLLKQKNKNIEGIWKSASYTVLIEKEQGKYLAYILESNNSSWKKGEVKFEIDTDFVSADYFMGNRSLQKINKVEIVADKYLKMGWVFFQREYPIVQSSKEHELYFKSMTTTYPFAEQINNSIIYLRLPSFSLKYKPQIDSVIYAWKDKILKTENLVIDLRDNGGGGSGTHTEIIPLLYTNPIRTHAVEFLSSEMNNQKWREILNLPELGEQAKKEIRIQVEKSEKKLGQFVRIYDEDFNVKQLDTIYEYPKSVGIIVNKNCVSSTETFLVKARQSKKVKIFGTQTFGATDISNMLKTQSPDGNFTVKYGSSKNLRVHELKIDDVGILPDYYIDRTIPDAEWLQYVIDILK